MSTFQLELGTTVAGELRARLTRLPKLLALGLAIRLPPLCLAASNPSQGSNVLPPKTEVWGAFIRSQFASRNLARRIDEPSTALD